MGLYNNFNVMYNANKDIKEKCHIISFSQNYGIPDFEQEGTNHPAMWAHYADNSNGVCIVIDKEAFIYKNDCVLSQYFYKFEDVEYSQFNTPKDKDINFQVKTPEEFIEKNWRSLFFLKHQDWAYEDEHRLFIMGYDGKLSIDGCIKYIVLGSKILSDKARMKETLDIVVDPKSICYRRFAPDSFASICCKNSGYRTTGIESQILEIVEDNISDPLYADYKNWLIKEQGYGL